MSSAPTSPSLERVLCESPNRVLVVGPNWVGDLVIAQTLLMLLKQRGAMIDVLAPAWSHGLLAHMPEVSHAIIAPFQHGELGLSKCWHLAKQLRQNHYQQVYVLPNSFKSALTPWLSRITTRTGYLGECRYLLLNDYRRLNRDRYPLLVQRFAALAYADNETLPRDLPHPHLGVSSEQMDAALKKFCLSTDGPILALCPGAEYGPAKRWPARYFAEIARYYQQRGYQIFLFGSAKDQPIAQQIQQTSHFCCQDFTGKTTLSEAICLMQAACAVVSNDSGLMHIAAAIEKPLVAIYGSSSPAYTPPLAENVRILSLQLPCSPCFKRNCPLHHSHCLEQLLPAQVLTALTDLGVS
jgi:heptosyltransferase-2